ncbi:putative phosphotransferase enzyme family protein [Lyophyllum shimeji]|uniref:Phosphotransferase enzyme family protein n=1 Tax=Lyophyllum shimeji TaxID=47721 RepID=A0A9P3UM91_LYOSH|nr:putative phosphotransferase enzyme family protein [Lyophyllum shimeji]
MTGGYPPLRRSGKFTANRTSSRGDSETIPDDHRIFFTRGDITSCNILVDVHGEGADDVEVVTLLDWEQAGWRTEFWEALKLFRGMGHDPEWPKLVKEEISPGHEDELKREDELLLISGRL